MFADGDQVARQCFLTAHLAGEPALFISDALDNEGMPFTVAYRTEPGLLMEFWDNTQGLGPDEWQIGECVGLVAQTRVEAPSWVGFRCAFADENAIAPPD